MEQYVQPATVLPYEGVAPVVAPRAFIAPTATVVGDVQIGDQASIWYGCILRGDVNKIVVGARTNLQDGTIVHVSPGSSPTIVGEDVLVGHNSLLHGCVLQDGCFVGTRATILNGSVVETGALVAAGALVMEGTRVPSGEVWGGAPARKLKDMRPELAASMKEAVRHYVELAERHARSVASVKNRSADDYKPALTQCLGALSMIAIRPLSLPNVIASHGVWTPDGEAVVCEDRRLTWRELTNHVNQVANGLMARGLRTGDKVATLLDNSIEMLEVILGTIAAGGVIVPLSALMARDALEKMIENSEAHFLFASSDTAHQINRLRGGLASIAPRDFILVDGERADWTPYEPWRQAASSATPNVQYEFGSSISILYTSGTTGVPKGMEHTHLSRLLYPLVLGPLLKINRSARTILTTPMYHNGTWVTMLPTLYAGGTVVIMGKFGASALQTTIARERCTHAFMVPTQLIVMLSDAGFDPEALRTMRVVMASGSPLSPQTFETLRSRLPSLRFCEIYGMGEGFMTFIGPEEYDRGKAGSVGRPILALDTDIQIIGDEGHAVAPGTIGEIVGTSALLLKGYYRDPNRTRESLWHDVSGRPYLRSGDLGKFDQDGFLHILGRKKDVIISGGVNIYSVDVEDVFMQHPDVLEAAAIGVPHDKWGETPLLLAIMKQGMRITPEELRDWGNARLGKTQRVSGVEFRDIFPRNALDKVMKRDLRELYWRGRSREIG